MRILSGELAASHVMVERKADVEGDLLVVGRLTDMFGAVESVAGIA